MIRLVPIAPAHAPAVQRLASDPAIAATSNVPSPYPSDGAEVWIRQAVAAREEGTTFAFAVLERDAVVGVVSLMGVDRGAGTAGLGYWVGAPYWGRGIATAAARMAVDIARGWGVTRIQAACLESNFASRRVLEKAGFRCEGSGRPDPRGPVLVYAWREGGAEDEGTERTR